MYRSEVIHGKRRTYVLPLVIVLVVILTLAVPVVRYLLADNVVQAGKLFCPPGQDDDCKLVKHRITGELNCLPNNAVADPWEIVPDGKCEKKEKPTDPPVVLEPTATATTVVVVVVASPTPTNCPPTIEPPLPPKPTAPPEVIVYQQQAKDPAPVAKPTATPICDMCELKLREVVAEERQANALEGILAWLKGR